MEKFLSGILIDGLLRPLQFFIPIFGLCLTSLLLLLLEKVRVSVLPSELVFYSLLGALFGFIVGISPDESITQIFAALSGVLTFFGASLLRKSRVPSSQPKLDAILVLGCLSISYFIIVSEFTSTQSAIAAFARRS